MNNKINEQTNQNAGKTGNKFSVGDKVRFRKGLPREIFGPIVAPVTKVYVDKHTGIPMAELDGAHTFGEDLLILADDESDDEDEDLEKKVLSALECCVALECHCATCPYKDTPDCAACMAKDFLILLKRYRALGMQVAEKIDVETNTTLLACDSIKCEDCFMKDGCLCLERNDGKKELYDCVSMHSAVVNAVSFKLGNIIGRKNAIEFVKMNPDLLMPDKGGEQ